MSEGRRDDIQGLLAEVIACAGVFDVSTDYEGDCKDLEAATQAVLDHVKAIRDERDRLRKALEDIRDSIGNGALNVNWIKQYAEAALTPAAKGGDDD